MAQYITVTLSITLAQSGGYQVVYTLRYIGASAASGFMIPQQEQLRVFLQYFQLAPEDITRLLTAVHTGSTERLTFGWKNQDYTERILRSYASW